MDCFSLVGIIPAIVPKRGEEGRRKKMESREQRAVGKEELWQNAKAFGERNDPNVVRIFSTRRAQLIFQERVGHCIRFLFPDRGSRGSTAVVHA
jgi:hypothetical protein